MKEKFDKSREVFTTPGVPEPAEITEARERNLIEGWVNSGEGPNTPEWLEFLSKVNFPVLKKTFEKIGAQCRISPEAMNFVDAGRIFSRKRSMSAGLYSPENNVIILRDPEHPFLFGVSPEKEEEIGREIMRDIERIYGSLDMCRIAMLVHEETHAESKNVCIGWTRHRRGEEPKYQQTGFSRTFNSNDVTSRYAGHVPGKSVFHALNEGMVEKLSREALLDYLKGTDWPDGETKVYEKTLKENPDALPYSLEVSLVDALTKKLAEKNGQTERVAWEAMVNALFHGETFEEAEIIDLFKETFGDGFLDDLANLYSTMFTGAEEKIKAFKLRYGLWK